MAAAISDTSPPMVRTVALEVARELGSKAAIRAAERLTSTAKPPRTSTAEWIATAVATCRMQVVPVSRKRIHGWIRQGALAIAVSDEDVTILSRRSWRGIHETIVDDSTATRRWRSLRGLDKTESDTQWFVVSSAAGLDDVANPNVQSSPWQRLWALARIEKRDITVVAVYAATLGLLTLVTPVATQALVNTIAFGAILQPLIVLTIALLVGLGLAGGLAVVQAYIVEVLQRRIVVRFAEDLGARLPQVASTATDQQDLVELNNRFLDVITVQKTAAELLLVGLGLGLQTLVGMILLGFYHPALLAFSLVTVVCLVGVVYLGRGGTSSAVTESKSKYAIVSWLDELARCPQLFAGGEGRAFAAERTADRVHAYVRARQKHYRHVLAVLIGGVALQVLVIVALLGLGGYLVIERQLTLGQLVAAEIVVGAIAVGFGKLGRLADKSFDLVAAADKLGQLLDLPLRPQDTDPLPTTHRGVHVLAEDMVAGSHGRSTPPISLELLPGKKRLLDGDGAIGKSVVLETLAGERPAQSGRLTWDGRSRPRQDDLRESAFLARPNRIVGETVLGNLRISDRELTDARAWQALEQVGLAKTIDALGGLDTRLLPNGAPLSSSQQKRLLLARAIVAKPRLLLIDGVLDFLGSDDGDLVELFLGDEAPWTAVVASQDERVRAKLDPIALSSSHSQRGEES